MTADIDGCRTALAGFDLDLHPDTVRQKSRDFYWYSPILKRQLADVTADMVVAPRSEAEVVAILAICHAHVVPVTVRGAGTGNYGQAMPLFGGVVMHMKHMDRIHHIGDDHMIAESGAIIADLEAAARGQDREIRLYPSTTASATIGGFIAGGSSGVGAIRWGGLRNPANLRRIRLVTMEATPRILDLTGADIAKAAHAYGVNGVMTEVEIPIDPAGDWVDVLIGAPDFAAATDLAFALGEDATIDKRMLSTFVPEIPERYFTRHRPFLLAGEALIAVMVARGSLPALEAAIATHPGVAIRFRADRDLGDTALPAAFELAWNHTTLRALRIDPTITYLQMMLPPKADIQDAFAALQQRFGDEVLMHCEFTRIQGVVSAVGLPLVRFTSEARLEALIEALEGELGLTVFNPHRVTLEEGGMKRTDISQLAFKRTTDPKGLMNPGKMIAWTDPDWVPQPGRTFLFAE